MHAPRPPLICPFPERDARPLRVDIRADLLRVLDGGQPLLRIPLRCECSAALLAVRAAMPGPVLARAALLDVRHQLPPMSWPATSARWMARQAVGRET